MPINETHYRWRDLNGEQRAVLDDTLVELTNAFIDDVRDLHAGKAFSETRIAEYLPRMYMPRYSLALAKRFVVAFATMSWKLKDPSAVHLCANQAEELALYALIRATEEALPVGNDDLSDFEQTVFEDFDFKFLYDPQYDGIAEALEPFDPSITAYAPDDWFEPFNDSDRPVHPYLLVAVRPVAGHPDPPQLP